MGRTIILMKGKRCPNCGHKWVPRGEPGPRRCPSCGKIVR